MKEFNSQPPHFYRTRVRHIAATTLAMARACAFEEGCVVYISCSACSLRSGRKCGPAEWVRLRCDLPLPQARPAPHKSGAVLLVRPSLPKSPLNSLLRLSSACRAGRSLWDVTRAAYPNKQVESREKADRQDGIAKGREWQEVRSRLQRRGDETRKHRVLTAYQKPQKAACDEGKQWREVRLASSPCISRGGCQSIVLSHSHSACARRSPP